MAQSPPTFFLVRSGESPIVDPTTLTSRQHLLDTSLGTLLHHATRGMNWPPRDKGKPADARHGHEGRESRALVLPRLDE